MSRFIGNLSYGGERPSLAVQAAPNPSREGAARLAGHVRARMAQIRAWSLEECRARANRWYGYGPDDPPVSDDLAEKYRQHSLNLEQISLDFYVGRS